MLKGRLRLFQESLYFDYADGGIEERLCKRVGAYNGTAQSRLFRTKTPMELMLGDISQERFIESVNSAHDTILFSP